MYDSKPYYYGTGRRKHSVARVRVNPGSGTITLFRSGDPQADRSSAPDPHRHHREV